MQGAIGMAVRMDVNPAAAQAPQHVGAEEQEHHADRALQSPGEAVRNGRAQQQTEAAHGEQREGMAEPPGHSLEDGGAQAPATCGKAGDGRQMVEVSGVRRQVNVDLLRDEPLGPGDWVLIHVGFAMSRISAAAAEEQMRMLSMMGEDLQAMEEIEGYQFGQDPS